MHQPIDIEPTEPEPTEPERPGPDGPDAGARAQPAKPQTEAAPSPFDAALAELLAWIAKQEAIREQSERRHLAESTPQPEPARAVIRIPDDVPCFETV